MQKQILYFFETVNKTFHFLVEKHGFAQPVFEQDENGLLAKVRFFRKNIIIECLLDSREAHVDCKVIRIIDGKVAADYAVNEYGQIVRMDLPGLFRKRGVHGKLFREVGNMSFEERMQITLSDFAQMLQRHGQDILDDSPNVFGS